MAVSVNRAVYDAELKSVINAARKSTRYGETIVGKSGAEYGVGSSYAFKRTSKGAEKRLEEFSFNDKGIERTRETVETANGSYKIIGDKEVIIGSKGYKTTGDGAYMQYPPVPNHPSLMTNETEIKSAIDYVNGNNATEQARQAYERLAKK